MYSKRSNNCFFIKHFLCKITLTYFVNIMYLIRYTVCFKFAPYFHHIQHCSTINNNCSTFLFHNINYALSRTFCYIYQPIEMLGFFKTILRLLFSSTSLIFSIARFDIRIREKIVAVGRCNTQKSQRLSQVSTFET